MSTIFQSICILFTEISLIPELVYARIRKVPMTQVISMAMFLGMTDEDTEKVIIEAKNNVYGSICNQMN